MVVFNGKKKKNITKTKLSLSIISFSFGSENYNFSPKPKKILKFTKKKFRFFPPYLKPSLNINFIYKEKNSKN